MILCKKNRNIIVTLSVINNKMTYKIEYKIKDQNQSHINSRFYKASNAITALEMFKATCEGGSLSGEGAKLQGVYKKLDEAWKKVEV